MGPRPDPVVPGLLVQESTGRSSSDVADGHEPIGLRKEREGKREREWRRREKIKRRERKRGEGGKREERGEKNI